MEKNEAIITTSKTIEYVTSNVSSTRSIKDKDLVSFHKQPHLCLNTTVFENIGIRPGMYARYLSVDEKSRRITIAIRKDKPEWQQSKWYKLCEPKVSKRVRYCYIRTTNLLFDYNLLLLGCFEYETMTENPDIKFVIIKY